MKIKRDWDTSIDCRLLSYRQREAIDEANAWIADRRRRRTRRWWRRQVRALLRGWAR